MEHEMQFGWAMWEMWLEVWELGVICYGHIWWAIVNWHDGSLYWPRGHDPPVPSELYWEMTQHEIHQLNHRQSAPKTRSDAIKVAQSHKGARRTKKKSLYTLISASVGIFRAKGVYIQPDKMPTATSWPSKHQRSSSIGIVQWTYQLIAPALVLITSDEQSLTNHLTYHLNKIPLCHKRVTGSTSSNEVINSLFFLTLRLLNFVPHHIYIYIGKKVHFTINYIICDK